MSKIYLNNPSFVGTGGGGSGFVNPAVENLDMNTFDILDAGTVTAENFVSTIATGTSPFTVSSTTVVTNLNADLLDGQSGSYYLDSANFTGTDWDDLTDGGNTTLHTHDRLTSSGSTLILSDATDQTLTGNLGDLKITAADHIELLPTEANGASAMGLLLNAIPALTTEGSELFTIQNNSVDHSKFRYGDSFRGLNDNNLFEMSKVDGTVLYQVAVQFDGLTNAVNQFVNAGRYIHWQSDDFSEGADSHTVFMEGNFDATSATAHLTTEALDGASNFAGFADVLVSAGDTTGGSVILQALDDATADCYFILESESSTALSLTDVKAKINVSGGTVAAFGEAGDLAILRNLVIDKGNEVTISATNPAAARVYTIPDAGGADSFAFLAATQTFTNKTISGASNTLTNLNSSSFTGTDWTDLTDTGTTTLHTHSHANLGDLTTGDPHTQYALLAGRSGGQILYGGTASSDDLILKSTSNATKGKILIQEANSLWLFPYGTGAGNTTGLRFYELTANGTNYCAFRAPDAVTATVTYTLPPDDGDPDDVLTTDGSGVLTWAPGGGGSTPPFVDTTSIVEGSADPTKELRIEVDGLTTATTRVWTAQDADITVAGTAATAGGTGQTSWTQGDLLYASAANTLSKLAKGTANQVLRMNAAATVQEWKTLEQSRSITFDQPTSAIDLGMFFTSVAITVTKMACVLVGSSTPSVTWTIRHDPDRSATGNEVVTGGTTTTSVTTGSIVTSFNDATIPADSFVWLETTAKSGTVLSMQTTIIYTTD